jgi:hypothetical protein
MPLEPLRQWYCDGCGGIIASVDQGWLEYQIRTEEDGSRLRHSFRIVHHLAHSPRGPNGSGCFGYSSGESRGSLHLREVIGPAGLIHMIGLIDDGPVHDPDYSGPSVVDLREWAELMRRLYLPNYEAARPHWSRALVDGFFGDMNEFTIYRSEPSRNSPGPTRACEVALSSSAATRPVFGLSDSNR